MVKDYLKVDGVTIQKPIKEHPKRPVLGFDCKRKELSGLRFWGLIQSQFEDPRNFLSDVLVYNHCPLSYMAESGKNITPVDMKAKERNKILEICDKALTQVVDIYGIQIIVGIGRLAEERAKKLFPNLRVEFLYHPSPASSKANSGCWRDLALDQLSQYGIL